MTPRIAVVDYGIGNLRSAEKALLHSGAEARLTASASDIAAADAVVLPGVGAFGACMEALDRADLRSAVVEAAGSGRPFLGICVGMQMLFDGSDEDDAAVGLGIIPGRIRWILGFPRPQMQWNQLSIVHDHAADPMFQGLPSPAWMYFVHSLHGEPSDPTVVVATCAYGGVVNAAFRAGSVFATQFHPEKSGAHGVRMLSNFVATATEATR